MAGSGRLPLKRSAELFRAALIAGILLSLPASAADPALVPYEVIGDAIPAPLTSTTGDAPRGRAIVADRRLGLCLLCHSGPFPEVLLQGNLAPSLAGAGSRNSPGQLRLRLVDASRINPLTIMPPYYRTVGLHRVAAPFVGKPILDAQEIEDIVAFLMTLKEE
jgi:sulfur-oxidizing protein SoxX